MNAAQRLWESLGLPTSMGKTKTGRPTKFANAKPWRVRRPAVVVATHATALTEASRKYDRAKDAMPRSCNGIRESRRELERRMNWLRERMAEAQA